LDLKRDHADSILAGQIATLATPFLS
jgi:hypothetical protein